MAALGELAAQTTEQHGVTCRFECSEPVLLEDNHMATQLYCIAREAVTNALKHAQAWNITIHLQSHEHTATLRVQDDGIGLTEPQPDVRGMGLKIMRYRAGLINAHFSVGQAEPVGMSVICTFNKGLRDVQRQEHGD